MIALVFAAWTWLQDMRRMRENLERQDSDISDPYGLLHLTKRHPDESPH